MELWHLTGLSDLAACLLELQAPIDWQALVSKPTEQARVGVVDEWDLWVIRQQTKSLHHHINFGELLALCVSSRVDAVIVGVSS